MGVAQQSLSEQSFRAAIHPEMDTIGRKYGLLRVKGAYRIGDEADRVEIIVLIGLDVEQRLVQVPLALRPKEFADQVEVSSLGEMTFADGSTYVAYPALADPVAVRNFIRTILEEGTSSPLKAGEPIVDITGKCTLKDHDLTYVHVSRFTLESAEGVVNMGDNDRDFKLRLPRLLVHDWRTGAPGHTVSKNRLEGVYKGEGQESGKNLITAEFALFR